MGLVPELADFVVICFAISMNRLVQDDAGRAVELVPGRLAPSARVVEVAMPAESAWQRALELAGHAFGISLGGKALNPNHLARLADELKRKREEAIRGRALDVGTLLRARTAWVEATAPRLVTATKAELLLGALQRTDRVELVNALAEADLEGTSATALGRHVATAAETARAVEDELTFNVFQQLLQRPEPEAQAVVAEVRKALAAEALHVSLPATLRQLGLRGQAVLNPPKAVGDVAELIDADRGDGLDAFDSARARIAEKLGAAGPGTKLTFEWKIVREKKG
jgi:hypothetical protein